VSISIIIYILDIFLWSHRGWGRLMVFNTTFNNISVISWRWVFSDLTEWYC